VEPALVAHPPRLARKTLALEAPGGQPARVQVAAPTLVAPGERFALSLAVVDRDGYPSVEFEGSVWVRGKFAEPTVAEVAFRKGQPAVAEVRDLAIGEVGVRRFEARWEGGRSTSNPVCCTRSPGCRIFWGDPHVHTILSNCHADKARSLNFCYAAARYLSGLDWVSATDHVSNGRGDFSKWREQMAACRLHDDPPEFVTLPGYEASLKGGCGGDTNAYFLRPPPMFADEFEEGDILTLCHRLAEAVGEGNFFVVPHHTTRAGKHGEIPDELYPGERLMPVVEVHSKWGTSEYRGNPNPLKEVHPGPSYAVDLLGRGLRLGFVAGTDSHATMPAARGIEPGHIDRLPGLTAVVCPQLTRRDLFQAIRSRRCYATSLERIYLDFNLSGIPMGESRAWPDHHRPREIQVVAAAQSQIEKVEVIRNGSSWHIERPNSWTSGLVAEDSDRLGPLWLDSHHIGQFVYYYARVTCRSGAQAWSSPIWLTAQRRRRK